MSGTLKCNPQVDVSNGTDLELMVAQVPPNVAPVTKAGSLDDAYLLALTALPEGGTPTKFNAGSTGAVNAKIYSDKAKEPSDIEVDLITMSASYLFPVQRAAQSAVVCTSKTGKCAGDYDCSFSETVSATKDSQTAMKSSFDFYRLLLADPTASNAAKFTALLNGVKDGSIDPLDLPAKVNAFFKSLSDPLSKCTFDSFATVSTFAQNYVPVWADLSDSYRYNLFTPSDTSTPTKPAWKKVGSIAFKKARAAALSDKDAGFDITYTDAAGKTQALTMHEGMFVTKDNRDLSTIQLIGTFKVKSDITLVASDNVLIPVLTGAIGAMTVMAVALDVPADGAQTPWWDLVNSFWAKELLAILGLIAAVAAFILLVYRLGVYVQSKTKKAKTKEEREQIKKEALDALTDLIAERQGKLKKANIEDRIPDDLDEFSDDVGFLRKRTLNNNATRQKNLLEESIKEQRGQISELSKYGTTIDLEDASGELLLSEESVKKINDWGTFKEFSGDISGRLKSSSSSIGSDIKAKRSKLTTETVEKLQKAEKEFEQRTKEMSEATKEGGNTEDGKEKEVNFEDM